MAKLPDYTALGRMPEFRSGALTPQINLNDLRAIGDAGRAIGQGIASIGAGISGFGEKQQAQADQLELARAQSHFLTQKAEIENSFANDQDYSTLGQRYQERINQARIESEGMISNPKRRELFSLRIADDVVRGTGTMDRYARKLHADSSIADAEDRINRNLEVIGRTSDPADRARLVESTHEMIDGLFQSGFIDARQAGKLKRDWVEKLGEAWVSSLPPEQREEALRPYITTGTGTESRAAARNPRAAVTEPEARDYGPLKLPISVPGIAKGAALNRLKEAGVWEELPKPLKTKLEEGAKGWGALELSKADLDSIPDSAWRKIAPQVGLPVPAERKPAPQSSGSVVDRIVGVESGGNPTAKNPSSSAYGAGQFISSTWLSLVKEKRPDLVQGRSNAEILELRADPALAREMVDAYRQKNIEYLQARGIEAGPGAQYLAHFLGPAGAASVLKADPNTPVSELVDASAISSNRRILSGKTAGQVVAWSERKMQGTVDEPLPVRTGTPLDFVSQNRRLQLYERAQQEVLQKRNAVSVTRHDELELQIINAGAGKGGLPDRNAIESDPLLTPDRRNSLLSKYDKAVGNIEGYLRIRSKFLDPEGGSFNPYDKDERKAVDRIYQELGGTSADPQIAASALKAVVSRTGTVPDSVATSIRGGLVSTNPIEVQSALQVASNLISRNNNAFTAHTGEKDFVNAAIAYRHYVDDLGMSAEAATQKFMSEQASEYKAQVKARIKTEDVDDLIKKNLKIGDVGAEFDDSFLGLGRNPTIGFSPGGRAAMYQDFAELTAERYKDTGDFNVSKKQAAEQLKKVWGVTTVNGSSVVVRYPPEKAPNMAGIPNASDIIASQAIADIKTEAGQDVTRDAIRLDPIPGVTSLAFKNGIPAPYSVSWRDKNGVWQMLNPGKAFIADPAAARAAVQEQRRTNLEQAREAEAAAAGAGEAIRERIANDPRTQAMQRAARRAAQPPQGPMTLPADTPPVPPEPEPGPMTLPDEVPMGAP